MRLPRWTGTVVCIASGPSLTAEDCELVRASGHTTIVTNTTFRLCPWADALYGFDPLWWRVYIAEVRQTFRGRLFCQSFHRIRHDIECARMYPAFRSFGNSGANAGALAMAAGARRVVLLGYDCALTGGRSHHHGDHPPGLRNCDTLPKWPGQFERLARWAEARGVSVLNASRESALTCFERVALEIALSPVREAA
jgi:hypothetical protein